MPIERFDQWAGRLRQNLPLSSLKDATVGVDASYYIELALRNNGEYLIHAHGGLSLTLEREFEDDLEALRAAGANPPIFVFSGLDHLTKPPSAAHSTDSSQAVDNGFNKARNKEDQAKITEEFSKAKYPSEILHRYLQHLLVKYKIEFLVAPYSAVAQLSYMLNAAEPLVDCVMGATDSFLFNIDRIITRLSHGKDVSSPSFDFITKASCEERLKATPDLLRDAQLLLGTSFSVTFPPLEAQGSTKTISIQDAVSMLNTAQRSVLQLCKAFQNDQAVADLDYADRYKKAIMTIRHHIVMEVNGIVTPLDFQHAPGDVHEFVGQNLPEELFFYISRGILGSDISNWLTQGEITLSLPSGVKDSEPYRRLVVEQLNPIRAAALKVVAEQLNFYYQTRIIKVRAWDSRNTDSLTITVRDEPELKTKMSCWTVRKADLTNFVGNPSKGPLLSCLTALKDKSFAKKTTTRQKNSYPALRTKEEVVANAVWRFLQLRGYVNHDHEVTKWGQVLETTLGKLDSKDDAEGQALLAVELLRLGHLNGNEVDGTVVATTDTDYQRKVNTNLLSKVACLGRYQNKYGVGYCGTLDRSMLAFAWMVTALRSTLRNLLESVLTAMLLSGEVERERKDWGELIARFPLMEDHGAPLGIATKTYLDTVKDESISTELKDKIKLSKKPYNYFGDLKHGSLTKSFENAWKVFDAISDGAKKSESKEKKAFAEAASWLEPRR